MPNNKKHHYVPRFYLKRFSRDGLSIGLWNIGNKIKVPGAKLKTQCYKDYFYGKDLTLEKALGLLEDHTAQIFQSIDKYETLPSYISEDYVTLLFYMLIQYGRTTYSADVTEEMNDRIMKYLIGPKADAAGIDLSKVTIAINDSARYSLSLITELYPLIFDLGCKLILNKTNINFVTSDNPVVLYNQLFSFKNHGSNTGLASKGLQIFLPISSKKLLLFYDQESYSVGAKSKPFVMVTSLRDVFELNILQMTSAYENVFFEISDFDVEALNSRASSFRRHQKSEMSILIGEETDSTKRELILTSKEDVRTNLKLSFIQLTKKTKLWRSKYRKDKFQPVAVVRNRKLLDDHKQFINKVEKGQYKHSEFFSFLAQKYE